MIFAFPIETDVEYEFDLTLADGTAYTGRTDIQCHIALTDGGDVIQGMAAVDATELTTVPGRYSVTFDAVDSLAYVTSSRVGRGGYVVTMQGTKVLASDPVRFTTAPRASS